MSHPPQLGFDFPADVAQHEWLPALLDWIPPPALLATVHLDALDLNDEVFFSYAASGPYTEPQAAAALLLTLLIATVPYGALQLTITTPDLLLASPHKFDANLHYLHRRRFLLAVEQLNRMLLLPHRLPLPVMDTYTVPLPALAWEERTINPRELLGSVGPASAGAPAPAPARYILPLSVLSPSLLTFFAREPEELDSSRPAVPPAPLAFVMNDECVSAITYWLNNTESVIHEGAGAHNPTGVAKPAWRRRNSTPVAPDAMVGPRAVVPKRKRRKSSTATIPEGVAPFQALPVAAYGTFQPMTPLAPEEPVDVAETDTHDDDEPKPFPCPECDKQFKRLEHLKRHIRSVHLNIRPFHCKYCDKKFLRLDNLAQHSKTHFKVNANGTTTIIYGNPNPHSRGGRKKSVSDLTVAPNVM